MGETLDGSEYLNINADVAAVQMSRHLSDVGKLIFVSAAGGLKDEDGMIIDSIDLSSEYDRYMGMDWVKYGTRLKLKQFHRLLQDTTVLNEIFVTNPGGIVQSVMSTMEDTSDSDEDYVLKWKDSPGTVVYRSGSPLKERKEGPRFKVGLLGTCCVFISSFLLRHQRSPTPGARGYVGRELLKLLDTHPNFDVEVCVSRSLNDVPVTTMLPDAKCIRDVKFTSKGSDDPKVLRELYGDSVDVWVCLSLTLLLSLSYSQTPTHTHTGTSHAKQRRGTLCERTSTHEQTSH
jgi:hypothetical protein